jgi:hypothetical protein
MENQKFCTQIYAGSFCSIAKILDPAPIFFAGNVFAIKPKLCTLTFAGIFSQQQQPQSRFKNNLNHKLTKQTIELPDDTLEP